ncbi:MAG TPA: 3'(2'),5'-bisphosphate nucleotidase CysQ [Alphaproteobacteria bacterium]|jgi:myo-inositol-1(or 4)-monophosphatase|nr:3'(2'),5'-bisphosphate nucleotidase CysQ [Alphaproteobacteria bacterium]
MSGAAGSTPPPDFPEDAALLFAAVREAGALALTYFRGTVKSWDKKPGDPVSEADIAVNDLLRARLCGARPGYAWLSEESEDAAARLDAQRLWIVDPIDGTRAFLRGEDQFSVTAALVYGDAVVAGAVFNPATGEAFEAVAGGGAHLNGERIAVSRRKGVKGGRFLSSQRAFKQTNWTEALEGGEFHFINSIAYRLALVAAGRFDASITLSPKSDWDIAAGTLLIAEAGGVTSSLDGSPLQWNRKVPVHANLVAANRPLHRALIERFGGLARDDHT